MYTCEHRHIYICTCTQKHKHMCTHIYTAARLDRGKNIPMENTEE